LLPLAGAAAIAFAVTQVTDQCDGTIDITTNTHGGAFATVSERLQVYQALAFSTLQAFAY
jgi:hypothetical protein